MEKRGNVQLRICCLAVLFWFSAASGVLAVPTREATPSVLYFVGNEVELEYAARRQEELDGFGISWQFYRDSREEVRIRLTKFIRKVVDVNALQPVFIYGSKMDRGSLELLLPEFFKESVPMPADSQMAVKLGSLFNKPLICFSNPVMIGIFPTMLIQDGVVYIDYGITFKMCATAEDVDDEQWFREWLTDFWRKEKESLGSDFLTRN